MVIAYSHIRDGDEPSTDAAVDMLVIVVYRLFGQPLELSYPKALRSNYTAPQIKLLSITCTKNVNNPASPESNRVHI